MEVPEGEGDVRAVPGPDPPAVPAAAPAAVPSVPAAPAVEAGEVGPSAGPGVGLGEPAAVFGEEEVSVQGEIDVEDGSGVRQTVAVGLDELR